MIAAGQDLVRMRDYIVGRLSDDERRAFEERLVRDPELVRELERSLALREGLQQLRGQGYFAAAASRGRRLRIWLPTLAAAAVAGLALFLWWHRESGPAPALVGSLESRAAAAVVPLVSAHFTFVAVRGESTPDLVLPAAGWIEIRAAPVTRLTDSRYRVTVIHRDHAGSAAATVGSLPDLTVSSDGYVHCFVDASRLTAGGYLLRVEPEAARADSAEFAFNLTADANAPLP